MAGILAGLDAEIVAIALLFVAVAGLLILRPLLVSMAQQIPVIGPQFASSIDNIMVAFFRLLAAPTNAALGTFTSTLQWLATTWAQLVNTVVGFAQLGFEADWRIVTAVLPHAVALAVAQVTALVTAARAYSLALVRAAELSAAAATAALARSLATAFAQANAYSLALFRLAETQAAASAAAVGASSAQAVAAEHAAMAAAVNAANAYAGQVLGAALGATADAEARLGLQLGASVGALERDLAGGVSKLEREIAESAKAVGTVALGATAAVAADVALIRALRCIQRCAELGAVGDLMSLVDVAALLGLVELAVHNPQAFEEAWLADIQPLISGTAGELRQAIGV